MTFKPALWKPIAVVLSALNLVAVGFAARDAAPWHAGVHALLALAFGLWAQRLAQVSGRSEGQAQLEGVEGIDVLEGEVGDLRRELSEMQERLDFTERVLARRPESPPVGDREEPKR